MYYGCQRECYFIPTPAFGRPVPGLPDLFTHLLSSGNLSSLCSIFLSLFTYICTDTYLSIYITYTSSRSYWCIHWLFFDQLHLTSYIWNICTKTSTISLSSSHCFSLKLHKSTIVYSASLVSFVCIHKNPVFGNYKWCWNVCTWILYCWESNFSVNSSKSHFWKKMKIHL